MKLKVFSQSVHVFIILSSDAFHFLMVIPCVTEQVALTGRSQMHSKQKNNNNAVDSGKGETAKLPSSRTHTCVNPSHAFGSYYTSLRRMSPAQPCAFSSSVCLKVNRLTNFILHAVFVCPWSVLPEVSDIYIYIYRGYLWMDVYTIKCGTTFQKCFSRVLKTWSGGGVVVRIPESSLKFLF